ncbi:MAG: alpha/beta hydrolase [Ginsengibacter sp.]
MKNWFFPLSAIIGICLCFCCKTKPVNYGDNTAEGKFYDIRGVKMYCEIYGSGTPLLMIHGNGGSIKSFKSNIPFFAKKYKVIVLDSRAQGKTKDGSDSLSFEMMADDEAALLDELHIDAAYVIGWSDGGINALLLAMRHPEKVISLAATGANIWPDSTAFDPNFWRDEKKDYDSLKDIQPNTPEEKNDRKLFMLDWEQPHISLQSLGSIKSHALIICGDHDLISTEHTKLIAQNIPHGELWIVPNSGHATLKEHKDEFNEKVDQFFSKSAKK